MLSSAPHLCFVCIIRETRSTLIERYRPKLLRRKQGTMNNLRLLLVSVPPQCCISLMAYHCHLHLSLPLPKAGTSVGKCYEIEISHTSARMFHRSTDNVDSRGKSRERMHGLRRNFLKSRTIALPDRND